MVSLNSPFCWFVFHILERKLCRYCVQFDCCFITGGRRRDTQTVSSGSFSNTKAQCLLPPTSPFLVVLNFIMMVTSFV